MYSLARPRHKKPGEPSPGSLDPGDLDAVLVRQVLAEDIEPTTGVLIGELVREIDLHS